MASSSLSSSSAVSPDSKKMPGIATGTVRSWVRLSTSMVAVAHCSGVAFGPSGVGPRGGSFSSALLVSTRTCRQHRTHAGTRCDPPYLFVFVHVANFVRSINIPNRVTR